MENWSVFLCSFLIILVCWLPYFLAYFPGILSNDSVWQMDQVLGIRPYSNHHPFTHTMIIKLVYTVGYAIFGTVSAGIATYSFFQMTVMALIFSYVIYTIYRQGAKTGWCVAVLAYFALVPFHAMYSITMWKDILFGGVVLLFVISIWKLLSKYRKGESIWTSLPLFAVSGIFVSLLRTNGFLAFLLCIPFVVVMLRRHWLPVLASGIVSVIVVLTVLGPVLSAFKVIPVDTVEALSIPLQHISRMIVDEKPLTPEQTELIEQLAPVDEIKEAYRPYISDPVKNLIRHYDNQQAFSDNKADYLKLWVSLALKYPWEIIKAQADQTYGYWYPDVQYWNVWTNIVRNQFGASTTPLIDGPVYDLVTDAATSYRSIPLYGMIWSIGLNVLAFFALGAICIVKRKVWLLTAFIPTAAVFLTLVISTPVYAEFRYIYCLFTTLPFLASITFLTPQGRADKPEQQPIPQA